MSCSQKLSAKERLIKADFSNLQAGSLANEIIHATRNLHSNKYLDIKFKELDAKLKHKLEKMHTNILKWFIGISLTQIIGMYIPLLIAMLTQFGG